METNLIFAVLDVVWNFINECSMDPKQRESYIMDKKYFTRDRILTFKNIVGIILNGRKSNIQTNLESYFCRDDTYTLAKGISKSAFSQQRKKICPSFFEKVLEVFRNAYYNNYEPQVKKWKNWILTAIDGSKISLPDDRDIKGKYSTHKHAKGDAESPMARVAFAYDVLNELILTGHIEDLKKGENKLAIADILNLPLWHLYLMDRGYCSFALLYLLIARGNKFVCRCKAQQLKSVINFLEKGQTDGIVEMKAYQNAVKQLRDQGCTVKLGETMEVRAVKIPLSSGVTEVLLTNLTPEEATVSELSELYNLRWREEVAIGIMKNEEQLEIFTGVRNVCVEQDFYATLFLYNFEMMLEKTEEKSLEKTNEEHKKKGELPLAINHNECWYSSKKMFKYWLLAKDSEESHSEIAKLLPLFAEHRYSVRKGRKFSRTFRIIKLLGKYITLNNYRAVI